MKLGDTLIDFSREVLQASPTMLGSPGQLEVR